MRAGNGDEEAKIKMRRGQGQHTAEARVQEENDWLVGLLSSAPAFVPAFRATSPPKEVPSYTLASAVAAFITRFGKACDAAKIVRPMRDVEVKTPAGRIFISKAASAAKRALGPHPTQSASRPQPSRLSPPVPRRRCGAGGAFLVGVAWLLGFGALGLGVGVLGGLGLGFRALRKPWVAVTPPPEAVPFPSTFFVSGCWRGRHLLGRKRYSSTAERRWRGRCLSGPFAGGEGKAF